MYNALCVNLTMLPSLGLNTLQFYMCLCKQLSQPLPQFLQAPNRHQFLAAVLSAFGVRKYIVCLSSVLLAGLLLQQLVYSSQTYLVTS